MVVVGTARVVCSQQEGLLAIPSPSVASNKVASRSGPLSYPLVLPLGLPGFLKNFFFSSYPPPQRPAGPDSLF